MKLVCAVFFVPALPIPRRSQKPLTTALLAAPGGPTISMGCWAMAHTRIILTICAFSHQRIVQAGLQSLEAGNDCGKVPGKNIDDHFSLRFLSISPGIDSPYGHAVQYSRCPLGGLELFQVFQLFPRKGFMGAAIVLLVSFIASPLLPGDFALRTEGRLRAVFCL